VPAQGSLAEVPPAALVRSLHAAHRSVRLLLARADEEGELGFVDGALLQAAQGPRRGEAAVYQLLTWEEGRFTLVGALAEGGPVEVSTPVEALLAEGRRRRALLPALRRRLPLAEGARLSVPPLLREGRAALPPGIRALLHLLDGTRPLDAVLRDSPLDAWRSLRVLAALAGMGALGAADAPAERRTGMRLRVEVPIEYQSGGLWQESATFNLSAWGVFIRTAVPFDAGAPVLLRFRLPSGPMLLAGRVVWANPDPSRWGGMGMGIQFVDLLDAEREAIEGYLAQLVTRRLGAEADLEEPNRGDAEDGESR